MKEFNKDELKDVLENKPKTITKEAKIIYDGRQYAVRIPVKMAKSVGINPEKDKIVFEQVSPVKIDEKTQLNIKFVRG